MITTNDGLIGTDRRISALLRVFEFPIKEGIPRDDISIVSVTDLDAKLDDNYGHMALEYMPFLGRNVKRIKVEMHDLQERLWSEMTASTDERFWIANMACLIQGAKYLNELDLTRFNMAGLEQFLKESMENMRKLRKTEAVDFSDQSTIYLILADYVKSRRPNTIRVDHCYSKKTPTVDIKNLQELNRGQSLHVQLGINDKMLLISDSDFRRYWKAEHGSNVLAFKEACLQQLGMVTMPKGSIGAGTNYRMANEELWTFDTSNWPADMNIFGQ